MATLNAEINANALDFAKTLLTELRSSHRVLTKDKPKIVQSYAAAATLQGWREQVFDSADTTLKPFLLEAQNDFVLSFVLGHLGMWRPALQSLRSGLENVVRFGYFLDHPIELEWFRAQEFPAGASMLLREYYPRHPALTQLPAGAKYPEFPNYLRAEYGTLSKAVHASAASFLMTGGGNIAISTASIADYGKWFARHRNVLTGTNLLLLLLGRQHLTGARLPSFRKHLASVLSPADFPKIKKAIAVTLKR